ncbi:MAG: GyrI-like domain-containing protein [Anaerolineae bacterium]|jgi:effector-binding domain-containing protein|nr:GyrI-like domain-containing protein [Anaerolineae bacterium]
MTYECEIKETAAQPTLSMRITTAVQDLPQAMGNVYQAVALYLQELGEAPVGAPFSIYYNMDMEALDVEIGYPVAKALPGKGEIKASEMPGGKIATCIYTGPYSDMAPAYDALTQWVQEQSYTPTGVTYEIYLNDPMETAPEGLQTQIVFPLV